MIGAAKFKSAPSAQSAIDARLVETVVVVVVVVVVVSVAVVVVVVGSVPLHTSARVYMPEEGSLMARYGPSASNSLHLLIEPVVRWNAWVAECMVRRSVCVHVLIA
jgi:hypothetical protein